MLVQTFSQKYGIQPNLKRYSCDIDTHANVIPPDLLSQELNSYGFLMYGFQITHPNKINTN